MKLSLVLAAMTMRQQLDEVEIRLTADADATVLEPEQRSKDKTDWWPGAGRVGTPITIDTSRGATMETDQSARRRALERLEAFVGEWTEQVDFPDAPPGRTVFEWVLGKEYLFQHSEIPHPDFPDSISIIAVDADGEAYTQHYFDSRGVVRVYTMAFSDGSWTLVRDAPDFTPLDFSQRFTGTFAADGNTIHGAWELSNDGVNWEHDFDLTYTKIT